MFNIYKLNGKIEMKCLIYIYKLNGKIEQKCLIYIN